MKRFKISLGLLAIIFAIGSAFTASNQIFDQHQYGRVGAGTSTTDWVLADEAIPEVDCIQDSQLDCLAIFNEATPAPANPTSLGNYVSSVYQGTYDGNPGQ